MEGLALLLVAILLGVILIPVGIAYGIVRAFWKHRLKTGLHGVSKNLRTLAVAVDIYGNVACGDLLNQIMKTSTSPYVFGQHGQTVSAVLGLNELADTLVRPGRWLVKLLNWIEQGHSRKAALLLLEQHPEMYPEISRTGLSLHQNHQT